ncbi:MAG: glycosyltransferase [Gemmataceae bacterium]
MAERPAVAAIHNALTPYRLHYHRRIVREMPEVELWSVFTHDTSDSPWAAQPPADIRPIAFGSGESTANQGRLGTAIHEWRKGGRIIRWLHDRNVGAVVLGGYNDLGRLRILRWCHRHGIPCFLFGDSNVHGDRVGRLKRVVLPRVLRWCTGVMPCGTAGQDYFARYGVARERMFLTPYEPDYAQIATVTNAAIEATLKQFRLDPQRRSLLYSGRLVSVKRVDLVIDAFAQIAQDRPDWDLAILGGGPLEASLRTRVPPELVSRVRWLGFVDDQAVIAAVCRACSVLVLASDAEPWAVVVNEAVAAGIAVVASDAVGAAVDLVREGVNGRVFPRGDLSALTDCLRDVTVPGRAAAMGFASATVLADWRQRADPVDGLRAALRFAGVLS